MNTIDLLEFEQMKKNTPAFKVGDTVKVHVKIVEGRQAAYPGLPRRGDRPSKRRHQ